jgi:hypothetical protein
MVSPAVTGEPRATAGARTSAHTVVDGSMKPVKIGHARSLAAPPTSIRLGLPVAGWLSNVWPTQ